MPKRKNTILGNWPKHLLQWLTVILIVMSAAGISLWPGSQNPDIERYCPVGGIQALAGYAVNGTLACSMSVTQMAAGAALVLAVLLAGKLFCGYICPVGLFGELFFRLRSLFGIRAVEIRRGSFMDKALRLVKYFLLFVLFYMTVSSSELFCRNFDPFYAVATGFDGEITLWMSVTALVVLAAGSMLVDMFWCRYVCPAGALANMFKYVFWVFVVSVLYVVANLAGANLPWYVFAATMSVVGYVLEAFSGEPRLTLSSAIHKDNDMCNHICRSCDNACPQRIVLSKSNADIMRPVDCTLCGDCVAACPKRALSITRSRAFGRYFPAVLTITLFAAAVVFSSFVEIPTINMMWGQTAPDKLNVAVIEDLTGLKCYGSSMSLKGQLERIDGVYGLKTYVADKRAEIMYDPSRVSVGEIYAGLFAPVKLVVEVPRRDSFTVAQIAMERIYDRASLEAFGDALGRSGISVAALTSEFGCPARISLYTYGDCISVEQAVPQAVEICREQGFRFAFKGVGEVALIGSMEMMAALTEEFSSDFTSSVANAPYAAGKVSSLKYSSRSFVGIGKEIVYFSNYLSQYPGIFGVALSVTGPDSPDIVIRYCEDALLEDEVRSIAESGEWHIIYNDGTSGDIAASIDFGAEDISVKHIVQ